MLLTVCLLTACLAQAYAGASDCAPPAGWNNPSLDPSAADYASKQSGCREPGDDCFKSGKCAKVATATHLRWDGIPKTELDTADAWILQNTITVTDSATVWNPAKQICATGTYFMMVGWGPGGYGGIQDHPTQGRVAIFSTFATRDKTMPGKLIRCGKGAQCSVHKEGTGGMKSMLKIDWKIGEEVTMMVEGKKMRTGSSGIQYWHISATVKTSSKTYFIAEFERPSKVGSLSSAGFSSFVEDIVRGDGSEGYKYKRMAKYKDPSITLNGHTTVINKATFTNSARCKGAWGYKRTRGGYQPDSQYFFLSSGGDASTPAGAIVASRSGTKINY